MDAWKRIKRIAYLLLPPVITQRLVRSPTRPSNKPRLEYAPDGWQTSLADSSSGWNLESVAKTERARWEAFCTNLADAKPLGFSHEHHDSSIVRDVAFHNVHITYAYVIALAAHLKTNLSILDWGGGLGHYYQLAQAVVPEVMFEFHCKEVPAMVEVGKLLNPAVKWYMDESYVDHSYDLVMMNGSLQYVEDWRDMLRRLTAVMREYFFLTRVPVVEHARSFVAIQREYNTEMLHKQFNQNELLEFVESLGLKLVREFVVGDRPYIEGANEQCELRGWLFKRTD